MNSIKVSAIVSFYNSEEYVEKCLYSLINQSLKELEIIAIDDGSTDRTAEIIKTIAEIDDRILYIVKSNEGLASSRKTGMMCAKGEYISFVDGDDYLHEDMYLHMYNKAHAENLDIVQCNIYPVGEYDNWKQFEHNRVYSENVITGTEFLGLYLKREVMPALWQRLFRNGLWKAEQFKDYSKIMSDHFNFPEWAIRAKRVSIINEPYYYWLTRKGSLGQPDSNRNISDAKNRFLSGISILAFSEFDRIPSFDLLYVYLMSYITQAMYHLKQNNYIGVEYIYEMWDRMKKNAPMYINVMMLYPNYKGIEFFRYLEEDRDSFLSYVKLEFWEDMQTFIDRTSYNGDEIFDRRD